MADRTIQLLLLTCKAMILIVKDKFRQDPTYSDKIRQIPTFDKKLFMTL